MLGPSIILAGLALGSGEFILWPYITYRTGFTFFFACVIGVTLQYFLNMEISRWALATGESAVAAFIRRSRHWAWIFLFMNVVPWMIPAWAKGAANLFSWLLWGPRYLEDGGLGAYYATPLAIAGMLFCGVVLTAGPVVYETIERIQIVLVSLVLCLVVVLAAWLLAQRPDALVALAGSVFRLGLPRSWEILTLQETVAGIDPVLLLGALAFAGAGGTTNLGQSNYIKDKGYAMGTYIGRITSPITGQVEAISETGNHFPHTPDNLRRWDAWWRAASWEHFFSFFVTCLVTLVLLSLISYALFYEADGTPVANAQRFDGGNLGFVWGEAETLQSRIGLPARYLFLIMGIAILLTTEFGVLDVSSRISMDIVKTAWLPGEQWSSSLLYFAFLWGTITFGSLILVLEHFGLYSGSFVLFKLTAALNGGVMFIYSALLLYINGWLLPKAIRTPWWRRVVLVLAIVFFGSFAIWAGIDQLLPRG